MTNLVVLQNEAMPYLLKVVASLNPVRTLTMINEMNKNAVPTPYEIVGTIRLKHAFKKLQRLQKFMGCKFLGNDFFEVSLIELNNIFQLISNNAMLVRRVVVKTEKVDNDVVCVDVALKELAGKEKTANDTQDDEDENDDMVQPDDTMQADDTMQQEEEDEEMPVEPFTFVKVSAGGTKHGSKCIKGAPSRNMLCALRHGQRVRVTIDNVMVQNRIVDKVHVEAIYDTTAHSFPLLIRQDGVGYKSLNQFATSQKQELKPTVKSNINAWEHCTVKQNEKWVSMKNMPCNGKCH